MGKRRTNLCYRGKGCVLKPLYVAGEESGEGERGEGFSMGVLEIDTAYAFLDIMEFSINWRERDSGTPGTSQRPRLISLCCP